MRSLWTTAVTTGVFWSLAGVLAWEARQLSADCPGRPAVEAIAYLVVAVCGWISGGVYTDERWARWVKERKEVAGE